MEFGERGGSNGAYCILHKVSFSIPMSNFMNVSGFIFMHTHLILIYVHIQQRNTMDLNIVEWS